MVEPSISWGGGVNMTECLGDEDLTKLCKVRDTDAVTMSLAQIFMRRNPQAGLLSLQRPYALHCDFSTPMISAAVFSQNSKCCIFRIRGIKLYTIVLLVLCFLKFLTKLWSRWSWSRR